MLQALVLAAHSIEATAAAATAASPRLLTTWAPVQVRLGDGEAQVSRRGTALQTLPQSLASPVAPVVVHHLPQLSKFPSIQELVSGEDPPIPSVLEKSGSSKWP